MSDDDKANQEVSEAVFYDDIDGYGSKNIH